MHLAESAPREHRVALEPSAHSLLVKEENTSEPFGVFACQPHRALPGFLAHRVTTATGAALRGVLFEMYSHTSVGLDTNGAPGRPWDFPSDTRHLKSV
jgi:hypothetical protein